MRNRSLLWTLVISFASVIVMAAVSIVYTGYNNQQVNDRVNRVISNDNHQWCELLTPLDQAYSSSVPQSELGQKVAKAIDRIHDSFNC